MRLYQVTTPYLCMGIIIDDKHQVVNATPVLHWTIDKTLAQVQRWVVKKYGTCTYVTTFL